MPEITLIAHDGFVKQLYVPNDIYSRGCYRIASQAYPYRVDDIFQRDSVFDLSRQVVFHVRDFVREGHTSVFKER